LFVGRRALIQSRSNARLFDQAATFLSEHSGRSEILVLGPTRAAANELALTAFERGCQGVHALTVTQLAANLAARTLAQGKLVPISQLGMEALANRIVHAATQANELHYFGPVAQTPGFPRAAAKSIAELRLECIDPRDLAATGEPGSDLARLMKRYEGELEERSLADLAILLRFAAEEVESGSHRFARLPLVLLGLTIESLSHEKLLAAMIDKSPDVLATAITDDDRTLTALKRIAGVRLQEADVSEPTSTLDRVRAWLFSPEQPPPAPPDAELLFSAAGESLECVEIARRIRRLAAQGTSFDRVAILLRNVEQYQPLVEEALRRAAIPGYFSRGAARPDPAGHAFLALLACAGEGCSASRFAEYLSLGQLPLVDENGAPVKRPPQWVPPDDEVLANFQSTPPGWENSPPEVESSDEITLAVPNGWEKLLVDAAVIGGHGRWARRLRGLRAELQAQLRDLDKEDESHRAHIERRVEQLARLEHFTLPLIDVLGSLPRHAHWREWLERLTELAPLALRHPESVLAVLSELEPMAEVGPVSLDEVYDVLWGKMGRLRTDPGKRRYGQVFIGSIDEARGRAFDVVFLPGLAEGLFPRRALEDPLLLDQYRDSLNARLDTQQQRTARERMLLRSAAAAARARLVVSYPRMDVTQARARVPSFYALEVVRAAEGRLPSLREFEKRAAKSAPSRLEWPAPADPEVAIDDAEYDLASLRLARATGSARYLMEANPHLARSLRTRWLRWESRWSYADGIVNADEPTRKILATHLLSERSYSPSALQHFAACPYRFLLQAIFQFRPREAPLPLEQMDPLTRGALFHSVQFELFRTLKEADLLPITPSRLEKSLDIADRVLDRVAARFEDDLAPAIPRVWKTEVEDLRIDLRGWLKQVGDAQYDWRPIHFELGFGLSNDEHRDPQSVKQEAVILKNIRLRGSIDLVERHATRNVLRVTDHKTGKAPANRPQYVGGGVILQPLLYALAAEKLLRQPVESGGLFFCTQRGDFSQVTIPLDQQSRERMTRVLQTIGEAIEEGFLPAAPQPGACALCDYRPVCGPYEEQRSKRKQPDRLDALVQVRNLP
jgi:CRISPR/Cas system-associated exonuclease Cas4 (RecB family)